VEPCNENCEHKAKSDRRIALLADRMAVMIALLGARHNGWEWLFGEHMWQDPDGIAEEIREWNEYRNGLEIVKLFIRRDDEREKQQREDEIRQRRHAEAVQQEE